MISSCFGHFLDRPLTSLAKRLNINPNTITVAGFIVTVIAAVVLSQDLFTGGLLIILGGLFDVFDGVVARVNNRASDFGAFLDSVLDRYSDAFLFMGFAWYFLENGPMTGAWLSSGTMIGALVISYARARAEGLGRKCHTGLMERPERIVLMSLGALTGYVLPVMWIMLVLTHVTVLQRILHVRRTMKT
ncbi:MAG: CDP-alcohol phosphatidyltransferase family protein [Nitrospirota bacterium]|nr:CDP-alcohol phosphatidyltransferase family protein [Nitrospirota bacterium]